VRQAQGEQRNQTINVKVFNAHIGSQMSHSFFIAGSLDKKHNCEVNTSVICHKVLDYQSAQAVLEISLTEEFGRISDMNGQIKLPGNIYAKASDQSVQDSLVGTMVWSHKETSCPQGLTQLYRGAIRIFSNESSSFALLEEKGQLAGLELQSNNLLCHHPSYVTHLRNIAVVIHPDNFTSIATDGIAPSQVTDDIWLESELAFLHARTTLSHRDRLRQVKLAICETRRQVAPTRLEAIAGSDKCVENTCSANKMH
jgi:hypothetical protein